MKRSNFRRYLPKDPDSDLWGWRLIDTGSQSCAPEESYPPKGHPNDYLFDRTGGRVLQEYQIVALSEGKGVFASSSVAPVQVGAGDVFLVFPGEWHRYAPDQQTGWVEHWSGFDGAAAQRIMEDIFSREQPVFRQAAGSELMDTFARQAELLRSTRVGSEQLAASLILQQLTLLHVSQMDHEQRQSHRRDIVILAKAAMVENPSGRTDFEALASEAHLSYSRFRILFKKETGYSPRAFENLFKLNRARDLLLSGNHNVSTVADTLGYSSVYYFSRAYKSCHGHPPSVDLSRHTTFNS